MYSIQAGKKWQSKYIYAKYNKVAVLGTSYFEQTIIISWLGFKYLCRVHEALADRPNNKT